MRPTSSYNIMWSSCQIRCCTHQRYASLMITEFTLQELGCPRAVSVCSFFLEPDVGDSGAGSPFSQLLTWALHIDSKAISPTNRLTRGGLKGNRDVLYHPGHTTMYHLHSSIVMSHNCIDWTTVPPTRKSLLLILSYGNCHLYATVPKTFSVRPIIL